jgi:hypothetical protein
VALTRIQRAVCRLLADHRRASGESYIAGGVALTVALAAQRVSRDIDIFHDTVEAVSASWDADRRLLESAGYTVQARRERSGFVEAAVTRDADTLIVEWVRDSAYRFFPLVEHEEFGLALHPFDLATNKVLALIGRTESRDWIDVIECHRSLQPLGYLSWAACGKDPGFTPAGILAQSARASHYSQAEIDALAFEGTTPRADALSRRWHAALDEARSIVAELPAQRAGAAVLHADSNLFRGGVSELVAALAAGSLQFHEGRIRGAWPRVR